MNSKTVAAQVSVRHPGKYTIDATSGGHLIVLDAGGVPGHQAQGMSPKQALISAILSCSTMDVIAWLSKRKVTYSSLRSLAESAQTETHPKIFVQLDIIYEIEGVETTVENLARIREAVDLSMSKYCGVSAMVSKTVPMYYTVRVNGEIEHRGQARFF